MITHNNHPEIDDRFSVMEVEEVARGGWRSAWGEVVPSFRVVILRMTKKRITNKKYNLALNGCQRMTVNATTNQK